MAIQVSGTYGSRREEAQRLGRILRPKARSSHFYTLVSQDTREQEFAAYPVGFRPTGRETRCITKDAAAPHPDAYVLDLDIVSPPALSYQGL